MKYKVTVEGNFVKEFAVEAASMSEAERKAKEQFDKDVGLMPEDYVIDSVMTENDS